MKLNITSKYLFLFIFAIILIPSIFSKVNIVSQDLDFFDNIYLNSAWSAGRLWGGEIHTNGEIGKVNITAGQGLIKLISAGLEDIPTSINDGQASKTQLVTWDKITEFELAGIGYNLIYWDASENNFSVSLRENFYNEFDFTTDFTVGRVYYDGIDVTIRLCGMNMWNFPRRVQMFGEERFPVERATGLWIGGKGLNITVSAGVIWAELVNRFSIFTDGNFDSTNTNMNFTYWYRNTTNGWLKNEEISQIDNQRYDDGSGVLQTLTANRYGVHWVYVVHDSGVHVVYGQGDYTLANANTAPVLGTIPGLLSSYATLVGKIIVQKDALTFTSVQSPFLTQFTAGSVENHNDLSGIQGGKLNEYYHLNSGNYSYLTVNTFGFTRTGTNVVLGNINDYVGVGTTTPYRKVEIVDNNIQLQLRKNSTSAGTIVGLKLTPSTLSSTPIGSSIYAYRTNTGGSGDTDLVFETSELLVLKERLRLKANGDSIFTGNLNVTNNVDIKNNLTLNNKKDIFYRSGNALRTDSIYGLFEFGSTTAGNNAAVKFFSSGGFYSIFNVENTKAEFLTNPELPIIFSANITEKMRIQPNGFVGIGKINPNETLDVNGNVQALSFITVSDEKAKTSITETNFDSYDIKSLKMYNYNYVIEEPIYNIYTDKVTGEVKTKIIGYQNVTSDETYTGLLKDSVPTNCQKGNGVDLYCLVAMLSNKVQELEKEVILLKTTKS